MTQILNVSRNNDGQYEIVDQHGKIVEGPFDTNAAAWKALDRLDNDMLLDGRRSNEKVLWGKPDPKKSKRGRRKEKKRQEQMTAKQEQPHEGQRGEGARLGAECRRGEVRSSRRAQIPRLQAWDVWPRIRGQAYRP
jgi:hypothetical protein